MGLDKLARVMWLLRKRYPNGGKVSKKEVYIAIGEMCGTDPKTLKNNLNALLRHGYLERYNKWTVKTTNKHITG